MVILKRKKKLLNVEDFGISILTSVKHPGVFLFLFFSLYRKIKHRKKIGKNLSYIHFGKTNG